MDFTYDHEQLALRDAVRRALRQAYPQYEDRRRVVREEPGFDEALWSRLAGVGALGLPFEERFGGAAAGPVEVGIVCQELGRVIAPEPYLHAVVWAGGLVSRGGTDAQRAESLGGLSSGELVVVFAHDEPGRPRTSTAVETRATETGGRWLLSGVKEPVPHLDRADLLVVSAALPDGGTGLFLVAAAAPGLRRQGFATHDGGRAGHVVLDGADATPLGSSVVDARSTIEAATAVAQIMAANQAIGLLTSLLELTTGYLRSRRQFGVAIGDFQALQFRAAEMYVAVETTRSVVDWATMVAAAGSEEQVADAAARAALQVTTAGRRVAQDAVQLHGGIGMTAEYQVGAKFAHFTLLGHVLGDAPSNMAFLAARGGDYDRVDVLA